jgi:hypothetical protein
LKRNREKGIHTKLDISATAYLVQFSKDNFYEHKTVIGDKEFAEINTEIQETYKGSLSKSSIMRFFQFIEKPRKINYSTLDQLVLWCFDARIKSFKEYVEEYDKEIIDSDIISNERVEEILITLNKEKKEKNVNELVENEDPIKDTLVQKISLDKNVTSSSIRYWALAAIIGIVSIVGLYALYLMNKSDADLKSQINIEAENIILNDLNRIMPNHNTQYFDTNGFPKVWYSNYSDRIELFNANGLHPITKEPLKPVTKQIVERIKLDTNDEPIDKAVFKRDAENKQETVVHNSISLKENNAIEKVTSSILNNHLLSNKSKNKLSLFIFDENQKLNISAMSSLKEQLREEGYSITAPLIASNKLNQEVISNLESLNSQYFGLAISHYTQHLCIGKITSSYDKSSLHNDLIKCNLSLAYTLIRTEDGFEIKSFSNNSVGVGINNSAAKQNALKKLFL